MTIFEEFGLRLKELRLEKGFSQEKFALKIGLDRTYYSSVEQGKRHISLRNIDKISKGFDISISDLFKGVEE